MNESWKEISMDESWLVTVQPSGCGSTHPFSIMNDSDFTCSCGLITHIKAGVTRVLCEVCGDTYWFVHEGDSINVRPNWAYMGYLGVAGFGVFISYSVVICPCGKCIEKSDLFPSGFPSGGVAMTIVEVGCPTCGRQFTMTVRGLTLGESSWNCVWMSDISTQNMTSRSK